MSVPVLADTTLPFAKQPWLVCDDLSQAQALLSTQIEERSIRACDAGRAQIAFTHQALPQIKLFGADFGQSVEVRSSTLANWHAIFPLTGAVQAVREGHTAKAGDMLLFTPGYDVQAKWAKGTKAVVLTLEPMSLIEHVLAHHQVEIPRPAIQAQRIAGEHPALLSLGQLLKLVDSQVGLECGLLATPAGQKHMQHLFCENLLHLIPALTRLPSRSVLPGSVKRVIDYIQAHLDQPLAIEALVTVAGCSRRSLEQAFKHNLGTSIGRYIKDARLKALRNLLLKDQVQMPLAELAHRWGFAHPSHFTAAYKEAFGETPSKTLSRQR